MHDTGVVLPHLVWLNQPALFAPQKTAKVYNMHSLPWTHLPQAREVQETHRNAAHQEFTGHG